MAEGQLLLNAERALTLFFSIPHVFLRSFLVMSYCTNSSNGHFFA